MCHDWQATFDAASRIALSVSKGITPQKRYDEQIEKADILFSRAADEWLEGFNYCPLGTTEK